MPFDEFHEMMDHIRIIFENGTNFGQKSDSKIAVDALRFENLLLHLCDDIIHVLDVQIYQPRIIFFKPVASEQLLLVSA